MADKIYILNYDGPTINQGIENALNVGLFEIPSSEINPVGFNTLISEGAYICDYYINGPEGISIRPITIYISRVIDILSGEGNILVQTVEANGKAFIRNSDNNGANWSDWVTIDGLSENTFTTSGELTSGLCSNYLIDMDEVTPNKIIILKLHAPNSKNPSVTLTSTNQTCRLLYINGQGLDEKVLYEGGYIQLIYTQFPLEGVFYSLSLSPLSETESTKLDNLTDKFQNPEEDLMPDSMIKTNEDGKIISGPMILDLENDKLLGVDNEGNIITTNISISKSLYAEVLATDVPDIPI